MMGKANLRKDMDKNYLIKTKHLGMRTIRESDIDYLKSIDKDPEVKEFFPEGTLSNNEIKSYIRDCIINCKYENLPCFVIFKLKDDEFVGESYFDQIESGEIKVGYLLHKKQWNKGYATEVLNALLDWAKINIDAFRL